MAAYKDTYTNIFLNFSNTHIYCLSILYIIQIRPGEFSLVLYSGMHEVSNAHTTSKFKVVTVKTTWVHLQGTLAAFLITNFSHMIKHANANSFKRHLLRDGQPIKGARLFEITPLRMVKNHCFPTDPMCRYFHEHSTSYNIFILKYLFNVHLFCG